jgi:hypothetical protein
MPAAAAAAAKFTVIRFSCTNNAVCVLIAGCNRGSIESDGTDYTCTIIIIVTPTTTTTTTTINFIENGHFLSAAGTWGSILVHHGSGG